MSKPIVSDLFGTGFVLWRYAFRATRILAGLAAVLVTCFVTCLHEPCLAQPSPHQSVPIVHFQADSQAAADVAERCAEIWATEGPQLTYALVPTYTLVDTVTCLIVSTENFTNYFQGRLPDWGVGVALPNGKIIAVDYSRLSAVGRGLREVFLHEMVHALLFQGSANAWLPTWIHEGTAMLYSGEWKFSDTVSLVMDGHVPELYSLQGRFPAAAGPADRAYRTSLLAVQRLQKEHGDTVIKDLLDEIAQTGDFRTAFHNATGTSVESFSRGFSSAMRLRFGWLVMLTRWPSLFVLMAVGFALGAIRKLVIKRRRLSEMDDFEHEDPDM